MKCNFCGKSEHDVPYALKRSKVGSVKKDNEGAIPGGCACGDCIVAMVSQMNSQLTNHVNLYEAAKQAVTEDMAALPKNPDALDIAINKSVN